MFQQFTTHWAPGKPQIHIGPVHDCQKPECCSESNIVRGEE